MELVPSSAGSRLKVKCCWLISNFENVTIYSPPPVTARGGGADLLASFPTDFGTTFAFPRFLFRERNSFYVHSFFLASNAGAILV